MPTLNLDAARKRLQAFDFEGLFVEELGWDRHRQTLSVAADDCAFTLRAVAEKRGFVVFVCQPDDDGRLPPYDTRRRVEAQVTKHAHEHLIVFVDGPQARQVWQWVRREPGQPVACREHQWHRGQSGEPILQRLNDIAIELGEEDELTLVHVTARVRKALDVDKVTKRFYDRFKGRRDAFAASISGIADGKKKDWYASVMLNRLMFVYFVQKKGFLDGDTDYLSRKLKECRRRFGADRFYS